MPAFIATQAPIFTLYGDGTIIFRNPMAEPPPAVGSVIRGLPFRTAKLSEEQIQELLDVRPRRGGLGVARASYENTMIADAATAIFTVDAGGIKKTVSVYALGLEVEGMPDALARAAFKKLADRLADFDNGGCDRRPTSTRPSATAASSWTAPPRRTRSRGRGRTSSPTDFPFPADPNAFQMAQRALTAADVDELGFEQSQGGFQGMILDGPPTARSTRCRSGRCCPTSPTKT